MAEEIRKKARLGHLGIYHAGVSWFFFFFSALLQLDKLANSILPEQIALVLSFATKTTETNS